MSQAQAIQNHHLDSIRYKLNLVEESLNVVNPSTDQELFIQYNKRPFSAPNDWDFEPCQSFYDTVRSPILCLGLTV